MIISIKNESNITEPSEYAYERCLGSIENGPGGQRVS
jgi:hypothetical protein